MREDLIRIQNRCFELMQEQINKRYVIMIANTTITVAALSFIKDEASISFTIMLWIWGLLTIFSIMLGFALIGLTKWQNTYKTIYIALNELLLTDGMNTSWYETNHKLRKMIISYNNRIKHLNNISTLFKSSTNLIMILYRVQFFYTILL